MSPRGGMKCHSSMFSRMLGLPIALMASFVLAAVCSTPWIIIHFTGGRGNWWSDEALIWNAFLTGPLWVGMALICVLHYRKRGLWILIGAPFALAALMYLPLTFVACVIGHC
jgi:hypothetical protein